MSNQTLNLDDCLYRYLVDHSVHEPAVLTALRHETAQHPMAQMQIAPEQGQFMALLVKLLGVKRHWRWGYLQAIAPCGWPWPCLQRGAIACDVSEDYTAIARRYWQQAGVDHKIDLRLAPAAETLDQLIQAGEANSFDFAFIDADKSSYPTYYEQALQLVRPGGLIAIDNVLRSGQVADPTVTDSRTATLRALNDKIHHDDRVVASLVPIADGLTLAMKKLEMMPGAKNLPVG